jgi:uncharacterized protein YjaG (DUF416 family)
MLSFNKDVLKQKLEKLSVQQRALFALSISKRLAKDENHADLEQVLAKFEKIVKSQSEDYDQDSIVAFIYAISSLINEDNVEQVLTVAQRGYDRADELAQEQLNIKDFSNESEEKIKESPSIQNELQAQEDALKELGS